MTKKKNKLSKSSPHSIEKGKETLLNNKPRPIQAILFFILGCVLFIALFEFTPKQNFYFTGDGQLLSNFVSTSSLTEINPFGKMGATSAVILFYLFGFIAYLFPLFCIFISYWMFKYKENFSFLYKYTLMFFTICSACTFFSVIPQEFFGIDPNNFQKINAAGGEIGIVLKNIFEPTFGTFGTRFFSAIVLIFICSELAPFIQNLSHTFFKKRIDAIKIYFQQRQEEKRRIIEKRRQEKKEWFLARQRLKQKLEKENATPPIPSNTEQEKTITADFADISVEPINFEHEAPKLNNIPDETALINNLEEKKDEDSLANSTKIELKEADELITPVSEPITQTPEIKKTEDVEKIEIIEANPIEKAENPELHRKKTDYKFPPLSLLKEPPEKSNSTFDENESQIRGQQIIEVLKEFGINASLKSVLRGPTITRYEIVPGTGVKVQKIINLQNEIAIHLRSSSVRIAIVSENGAIGIEISNDKPSPVYIREILESKTWVEQKFEIPIILGKDVTGKPVLMDLARMPHGLIAGSTGSGKSVCVNGIVTSILYSASPEDVQLVMVDPKVVELQVYNKIPHMLIPVITDAKKVPGALKWLINEMEHRYQLLEKAGVRNIVAYNAKLIKDKEEAEEARARAKEIDNELSLEETQAIANASISVPRDEGVEENTDSKKKLPYIICIVDEFADLMMQAPGDIEDGISRLTAKARAAGIHLLLATQRPDAKVVTGLIKANLPVRIAFKVTSGTNSRIILDESGAETLIGKGDMLFIPPGSSQLRRAQGSFVSDEEIESIVNFVHNENGAPNYAQDVQDAIDAAAEEGNPENGFDGTGDSNEERDLQEAWHIIKQDGKASASYLQRRMRWGFQKASRIIDILEDRGFIGPADGARPREILK